MGRGDRAPYHPLGFTHIAYPPADAAAIGIDLEARPSFDDVVAVWGERAATIGVIVAGLTDEERDLAVLEGRR